GLYRHYHHNNLLYTRLHERNHCSRFFCPCDTSRYYLRLKALRAPGRMATGEGMGDEWLGTTDKLCHTVYWRDAPGETDCMSADEDTAGCHAGLVEPVDWRNAFCLYGCGHLELATLDH